MPYYDDDYQPRLSLGIYNLRKGGQLDEARALAERYIDEGKGDIDVWKAYAWTLIDIGKRHKSQGDLEGAAKIAGFLSEKSQAIFQPEVDEDEFIATLVKKINEFSLSTNPHYAEIKEAEELSKNGDVDKALEIIQPLASCGNLPVQSHESYGWILYRYLKARYQAMNSVQVRTMLKDYMDLKNPRPSLLHSQILSFALNYSKEDKNFNLPAFFRLWGPENLRNDDYSDLKGKEEGWIPSLLARLSRAVVRYPQSDIRDFVELLPRGKDRFIEMMRDGFFWNIYGSAEDGKPTAATWDLFDAYLDFFPEVPGSENHSKILELAERWMQENNAFRFYTFFKRWDPSKLREADWEETKGKEEGVVFKPLAMKAIRSAKNALESLSEEQIGDLQWLINLYDTAAKKFPDDDWNIRSKGLLLLRAGHPEEARTIYKDLCLKMGEKFYIWQEFADCWDDNATKIALLCKAISVERNEDYIGKTRLALARQLIAVGKKENAAIELARYKTHYQEKGWNVSQEIENLLKSCGGAPMDKKANNDALYAENITIAEDCAFQDFPYTELTLVDMWKNGEGKELVCFTDGEKNIVFKKKRFPALRKSHKGQVWRIKLFEEKEWEEVEEWYPYHHTVKKLVSEAYTPLTIIPSETPDWGSLPLQYGYVQHVNIEKKVYHIFSVTGELSYEHYEKQVLNKGDYVVLRQYKKKVKDETKVFFCDIRKCKEEEAIEHFPAMIAAVDDVNEQKQLIHYVAEKGVTGVIFFNEAPSIRPSVGDSLKLRYVKYTVEDKKNPGHTKNVVELLKVETTSEINKDIVKTVRGELKLKYRDNIGSGAPDFGFVDDYYVHKKLLEKYDILDDCFVEAKAIKQSDGRWKVVDIMNIDYDVL